jgi:hypothetical protein
MDANDTICLCVANDFVQAEKRTSSPLLRFSTTPLLHFSASPLLRVADGWTDGRMDEWTQSPPLRLDTAKRTSFARTKSSASHRFAEDFVLAEHFSTLWTDGRRSSPPEHRSAKQRTSALRGSGVELCPGRRVHSKEVFNILKLAKEKNFNFNKILFKRAFMEKIYKKFFKKIFFFALPFLFFL